MILRATFWQLHKLAADGRHVCAQQVNRKMHFRTEETITLLIVDISFCPRTPMSLRAAHSATMWTLVDNRNSSRLFPCSLMVCTSVFSFFFCRCIEQWVKKTNQKFYHLENWCDSHWDNSLCNGHTLPRHQSDCSSRSQGYLRQLDKLAVMSIVCVFC